MSQSGRSRELLLAAADTFDDGQSPFHTEWLVDHRVTGDECMALSEQIAMGARLLIHVMKNATTFDLPGIPGSKMPTPEMETLKNYFLEYLRNDDPDHLRQLAADRHVGPGPGE